MAMDPEIPDLAASTDKVSDITAFSFHIQEDITRKHVSRSCMTAKLALMVPLTMQCHHAEHFASGLSAGSSQAISHIHVGYKDLGLLYGSPLGKGEGGYENRACCTGVMRLTEGAVCSWTLRPADPLFLDVRAGVV